MAYITKFLYFSFIRNFKVTDTKKIENKKENKNKRRKV